MVIFGSYKDFCSHFANNNFTVKSWRLNKEIYCKLFYVSFFINIDKLIYYSNNIVFFRLFLIILEPLLLYYLQNQLRGKWENVVEVCEHDFARRRQTFILSMLRDLHENARIRASLQKSLYHASKKKNQTLHYPHRAGFLPPVVW